jgi:hypothetical protein
VQYAKVSRRLPIPSDFCNKFAKALSRGVQYILKSTCLPPYPPPLWLSTYFPPHPPWEGGQGWVMISWCPMSYGEKDMKNR